MNPEQRESFGKVVGARKISNQEACCGDQSKSEGGSVSNRWMLPVIIALGLILRIPRVPGLTGADSFRTLWMGKIISEGYFTNWFISPFSLIGYYPFASYPIGGPLLVGLFLYLGFSLETTVLIISAIVTVAGTVGSYKIGEEMFDTEEKTLLFTAFYGLSNIFVRFTYFSLSVRGLYLAVLPWLLLYSIRLLRNKRRKDGFIAAILTFVLSLTHALAIYTLLYLVAVGLWLLVVSVSRSARAAILLTCIRNCRLFRGYGRWDFLSVSMRTISKHINRTMMMTFIYVLAALTSLILGVLVLGIDPGKTVEVLLPNSTLIGVLSNLAVDYFLRLGVISVFLPIGALVAFHRAQNFKGKSFHFILTIIVCLSLAKSLYASVVFLPVFGYYTVIGLSFFWQSDYKRYALLVILLLAAYVSFGYPAYAGTTSLYSILMAIVVATLFLLVAIPPNNLSPRIPKIQTKYFYVLLISMLAVTMVSIDGPVMNNPYDYFSNDEEAIIQYLDENSEGFTFVFISKIGYRLEIYGHITVGSFNTDKALYFDWITPEEIQSNIEINFMRAFKNGHIFAYRGRDPTWDLFNVLTNLDLTIESNLTAAKELGLRYVVVEKSDVGWSANHYQNGFSQLLKSTPYACSISYDGEKMALFTLP